jgi:molybdopterin-guanine dinucleotide biosynthesis protein A
VSDVTGVLLAGGASRRFPPNKLLHTYEGGPLFWRPLRALAGCCGEIVLVLAAGAPEPQLPLLGTSVRVVRDPAADQGPLVAVASALAGVTTAWALLVGGDMPDIKPALLRAMVERARTSAADVVALADKNEAWPMPALFRVSVARPAAAGLVSGGERRLRSIVSELNTERLDELWWSQHDPAGSWRRDIDRPSDLPTRGPDAPSDLG